MIYVTTYSPTQDVYRTANNNAFDLAYDMDGAAPFALIDSTTVASGSDATVTWSGLANDESYEWYAVADNGGAAAVSPTWSFTTETTTNVPPAITESDPVAVSMSEDGAPAAFDLTLHATDADTGDTLSWSVSNQASNGTASASGTGLSKTISYAPDANFNGSDSFVVQVSDGHGGTDTVSVNVTVQAVNDPPVLTNPGTQTNAEGAAVSLQVQASDVDLPAQTLTYGASGLPAGLTINPSSGLISGDIAVGAAANSPYSVTATVTDGVTPVEQIFTWNVSEVPVGLCGSDPALVA
jgi:VCBS repeat-containing protein